MALRLPAAATLAVLLVATACSPAIDDLGGLLGASRKASIRITSPADGAILSTLGVTISGDATAVGPIESIEVSLDGGPWIPASGARSWSVRLKAPVEIRTIRA